MKPRNKSKLRKILFRFFLLPVVILIVLVLTAVAILYSQQERLVKLAVKELNKKLTGQTGSRRQ